MNENEKGGESLKKAFGMISILITCAIVITFIFIAPDIDIIGDNFFEFAPIGLLISLFFALLSEKGIWRKAALGSLISVIILFGLFILIIRIVISGP